MKRIIVLTGLALFCMAPSLPQTSCPDLSSERDQDNDGISNAEDACCYVASMQGQNSLSGCGLNSNPEEDLNDNFTSRRDEGLCCVWEAANLCAQKREGATCPEGGIEAPCDRLIEYSHSEVDSQTKLDSIFCGNLGSTECICFTIGDFDGDGTGPSDNCPLEPNNIEENDDSDQWGNACDPCDDEFVTTSYECDPSSSEPGHSPCGWGADCVPMMVEHWVGHYCSAPPDYDGNGFPDSCDPCFYQDPSPDAPQFVHAFADEDDDGLPDVCDNCPDEQIPYQLEDLDGDGIGDDCDPCGDGQPLEGGPTGDDDGDGVDNKCDNCQYVPNTGQEDEDHDGVGNLCDNCKEQPNRAQENGDGDEFGNRCDMCPVREDDESIIGPDMDGDGVADVCDKCPGQMDDRAIDDEADWDEDSVWDGCDMCPGLDDLLFNIFDRKDGDGDGVADVCDICPNIAYPEAFLGHDEDDDGIWDECAMLLEVDTDPAVEGDADDDGILDEDDNCPHDANPDQADNDDDGVGDACSPFDDYTGAFTCRCESVGVSVGLAPTVLGFFYSLI